MDSELSVKTGMSGFLPEAIFSGGDFSSCDHNP